MGKQEPILISGLWIRKFDEDHIQVLLEIDNEWKLILDEPLFGSISHIVEPLGIRTYGKPDPYEIKNEKT